MNDRDEFNLTEIEDTRRFGTPLPKSLRQEVKRQFMQKPFREKQKDDDDLLWEVMMSNRLKESAEKPPEWRTAYVTPDSSATFFLTKEEADFLMYECGHDKFEPRGHA